ncbi:putative small subunit of phenylpropionate dioxygenase protein [Botrytis fragariae]|uniref:Putative small subunit of phenylpropionate dioxygenase protein n=1 Tax=Botrytis fragariae TaxID=1964551 RepID=A0A8H6EL58_9HELO|nr:putative small subunit of phenylpropionate dioxygenase protein [Botrytis fragariae]KAF5875925.1 putative small subunit of phenylpropionate dioxygenase protein [Botrytis fragariae]
MQFLKFLVLSTGLISHAISSESSKCPNISPGPASSFQLAELLPISPLTDHIATETIRNILSLYAFAIDGRNWQAFSRVFAPDARANYSEPLPVLYGLKNITDAVAAQITQFSGTHHRYSTQYIAICSPTSAISITYLEASHFFLPHTSPAIEDDSHTLFATGRYEDTWKKANGTWKIVNRNLVFIVSNEVRNIDGEGGGTNTLNRDRSSWMLRKSLILGFPTLLEVSSFDKYWKPRFSDFQKYKHWVEYALESRIEE